MAPPEAPRQSSQLSAAWPWAGSVPSVYTAYSNQRYQSPHALRPAHALATWHSRSHGSREIEPALLFARTPIPAERVAFVPPVAPGRRSVTRASRQRPSQRRRSIRDWLDRDCWPTSWPANSAIFFPSIGWKTSSRGRVSRSREPRSRSGVATWPIWSSHSMS